MNFKNLWDKIKTESKKRNPLTNFVLYLIQIISGIAVIGLIPEVIWSVGLLSDPYWTFVDAYGKGPIPGILAAITVFIGNLFTLRWDKRGVIIMLTSFLVVCLPLMFNEFIEFIAFLACMYGGILLYWLTLLLKKDGVSLWKQCSGDYKRWNYVLIGIVVFMTLLMPPIVGYSAGFKGELFDKGCTCIDAHLNDSYYYKLKLGKEIAFSSLWRKEDWSRRYSAEHWFRKALQSCDSNFDEFDRGWELQTVYANYVCHLLNAGDSDEAEKIYKKAIAEVPESRLRDKIESDYILKKYLDDYDAFVNRINKTNKDKASKTAKTPKPTSSKGTSNQHQGNYQHQEQHQHYEPQPHTVYEEAWIPCMTCHGNGSCTQCNGRGGYYIGSIYCVCSSCSGSGCCVWCGGRGQTKETRAKTVYY